VYVVVTRFEVARETGETDVDELTTLCGALGKAGVSLEEAKAEARRRGWRPFKVGVLVVPPIFTGQAPYRSEARVWGKTKAHAKELAGIQ
jgi:hypothetical protein